MRFIAAVLLPALFFCAGAHAMDEEADTSSSPPAVSRKSLSSVELERLVAPVALYPDSVLSLLLSAATYPDEVAEAARSVRSNGARRGEAAVRAAMREPWDTSVHVLVGFPELLLQLNESMDWTRQLGRAFLADESAMLDAVQSLRAKALAAGRLASSAELRVERRGAQIVIESASSGAMWLPWYDPSSAFGVAWPKASPPIQWPAWPGYNRRSGIFAWGPSIPLSRSFVYAGFDWAGRITHVASIRNYQAVPGAGSPSTERVPSVETAAVPETAPVNEPAVTHPAVVQPAVAQPAVTHPAPAAGVATSRPSLPVPLVGLVPQPRTELPVDVAPSTPRRAEPTPASVAPLVALGKPDAGRSFTAPAVPREVPSVREAPIVRAEPAPQNLPEPSPVPETKKPTTAPVVAMPAPPSAPATVIPAAPVMQPASVASVGSVAEPVESASAGSGTPPRPRRRVFISDMDSRTLNMLGAGGTSKVDRLHP